MRGYLPFLCLMLCSCAGFVSKFHRQFDNYDRQQLTQRMERRYQRLGEGGRRRHRRPGGPHGLKRPVSQQHRVSSKVDPYLRKLYRPDVPTEEKKRYKAADLNDSGNNGSLWIDQEGNNRVDYFFNPKNRKRKNDIVLIHVYSKLKREISQELKRVFPVARPKKKKEGESKGDSAADTATAATQEPEGTGGTDGDNVKDKSIHDKISSVVIDEVNREYLLLKGQKSVLYRNRKRMIEVQALVARRDIDVDNIIRSDDVLDTSVRVIR